MKVWSESGDRRWVEVQGKKSGTLERCLFPSVGGGGNLHSNVQRCTEVGGIFLCLRHSIVKWKGYRVPACTIPR